MKSKLWLFISILCIAVGLGLLFASGVRSGGDLRDVLSGAGYAESPTEKTYDVDERFSGVSVKDTSADVRLFLSPDGHCRVTCGESNRCHYTVKVEKDTLTIVRENEKSSSGFILYTESIPLCIYLPEQSYRSLTVSCTSGDVSAEPGFSFDNAQFTLSSGDVELSDFAAKKLLISCTSGEVELDDIRADMLRAESSSGDIQVQNSSLGSLELSCTSGEVELTRVDCTGTAQVGTTSGDIRLQDLSAESFDLSSTSGDVKGSLRGSVDFSVETVSGSVRTRGGVRGAALCRVSTTSGDIELEAKG